MKVIIAVMQKGKPMADLIGRQDAIDAIKNQTCLTYEEIFNRCLVSIKDENGWVGGIKDAIEALIDLPSAQLEQQWIPCSEPPTEHGFYHEILLYGKDGNYAVGWYDEDYFTWDDRFDMDTPVAWCKLPEPWRGYTDEKI